MLGPPSLLSNPRFARLAAFPPLFKAAKPPSCSSFQASQPPTCGLHACSCSYPRFGSFCCDALRLGLLFLSLVSSAKLEKAQRSLASRLPKPPGLRTPTAPSAPQRPIRCVLDPTKARSSCALPSRSCFVTSSCFCSCFCFRSRRGQSRRVRRARLEPPLSEMRNKAASRPSSPPPRAKPSVPRAFLFRDPKTILDRAGDDNLSKGLIDPFGWQ
jgi:hypothetical protein